MTSFGRFLRKLSLSSTKWLLTGLVMIPAIRLYYVREMIAALMIFSVLFAGAATIVLIIFLVDLASQRIMAWIEAGVLRTSKWIKYEVKGLLQDWARPRAFSNSSSVNYSPKDQS